MLIDTDVPGDGSLVTVINVGGVEITAFCHPVQLMLSFNATVGMNPLVVGGIAMQGDAPSNIDFQGIQGFPITKANPSGPLHYSGVMENTAVGPPFQLELHMSLNDPCRVWGSVIPLG